MNINGFSKYYYCTDIFLKPFVYLVELKLEKMDMTDRSNLTLAEESKSHNKSFVLILCQWWTAPIRDIFQPELKS